MPFPALILPFLIAAAAAEDAPIIVKAYPWAPFISPMGEPFRARPTGEAPIARWFVQADRNQDGVLTADEMQADADRFFTRLDSNQDGQIDPAERATYEFEIAPEVQVNSNWKRQRGEAAPAPRPGRDHPQGEDWGRREGDAQDGYRIDGLQGAARYGLLNIPQPVASADADFNRAVTQAEFRQAASYRFKLLDGQGQGRISLAELEDRLPIRPKGKRAKPRRDAVDTRVGLPLPEGE
jgi:Ca2+-binding EF-hand superfamily protein